MERRSFSEWLQDSAIMLGCIALCGGFAVATFLPVFV
jgi:hypothetical protein